MGRELVQLEQEGTLKKVNCRNHGAGIIPVPKKAGRIQICGVELLFKTTIGIMYVQSYSSELNKQTQTLMDMILQSAFDRLHTPHYNHPRKPTSMD